MIDYFLEHPDKILVPFVQHIELVVVTLAFSLAIAVLLTMLSMQNHRVGSILTKIFSVIYSIPSLALFSLMIPISGLGTATAVIVLTAYNQYLLLSSFLSGLNEVDHGVVEAAEGIGMTPMQILWKIQVPLAKASLFAGIRLTVVSTIGIGTIASAINAGGLGDLLFDGLRTMNMVKILWGSLLSAGLALGMNGLMKMVENHCGKENSHVAEHSAVSQ